MMLIKKLFNHTPKTNDSIQGTKCVTPQFNLIFFLFIYLVAYMSMGYISYSTRDDRDAYGPYEFKLLVFLDF